jgi:predicted alpha/beta-hydrolase family hydrolase
VLILASVEVREIDTPHGPAEAHIDAVDDAKATLVLGHGAGGGIEAVDLVIASREATEAGISVVRVLQPYRVAGRKSAAPAKQLDAAWLAVIAALRADGTLGDGKLISGGRSSGARVACRTAAEARAGAVLCLAFPVHPPGKADDPTKSRQGELDAVAVPALVIQGKSDPFGMPVSSRPDHEVVVVAGNHGLKADGERIGEAIRGWLAKVAG